MATNTKTSSNRTLSHSRSQLTQGRGSPRLPLSSRIYKNTHNMELLPSVLLSREASHFTGLGHLRTGCLPELWFPD